MLSFTSEVQCAGSTDGTYRQSKRFISRQQRHYTDAPEQGSCHGMYRRIPGVLCDRASELGDTIKGTACAWPTSYTRVIAYISEHLFLSARYTGQLSATCALRVPSLNNLYQVLHCTASWCYVGRPLCVAVCYSVVIAIPLRHLTRYWIRMQSASQTALWHCPCTAADMHRTASTVCRRLWQTGDVTSARHAYCLYG
jgi:hypothetical protein